MASYLKKRVNPRDGVMAGKFLTRNVQLRTNASTEVSFEFENPGMIGFGLGADVRLTRSGSWVMSFDVKSMWFEYTLVRNDWVEAQTLLDQAAWGSFNHLVLGIGRRW